MNNYDKYVHLMPSHVVAQNEKKARRTTIMFIVLGSVIGGACVYFSIIVWLGQIMNSLDDNDYQIPLDRFKELLADDGRVEDGSLTHTIEAIAHEVVGCMFIDEFTELLRSSLSENPNNILNPERVAFRFVDLVNRAADFYHKEEVQ